MFYIYVAFFLLFFGPYNGHMKSNQNDKVVCYVASWAAYRPGNGAFSLENLQPKYCTHLIYAYAGLNASDWTIRSIDPWVDIKKDGIGNYKRMTMLRKPDLKVLLSIGGWNEGSANYSLMASSSDRRKSFIASTVKFLKTYEFDGLDLDWEFPGNRGGSAHDKENFVSLVQELRDAFKHSFLLTAAISPNKGIINTGYDIPEISKYLDYIHVMAYNYHGTWDKQVLPNTPLRSKDQLNVEDTIMYLLQQEAPAEKLVLGLAMFGRTFVLTSVPETPQINPIGLPSLDTGFKGPYIRDDYIMGFNEICEELVLHAQEWTIGWDNYSSTSYAINEDRVIVYDDPKAIMMKVEYAKKQKLAGVMIWSIDTDDFRGKCSSLQSYPLMQSINIVLANNMVPHEEKKEPNSSSVQLPSNIVFAVSHEKKKESNSSSVQLPSNIVFALSITIISFSLYANIYLSHQRIAKLI